MRLNDWMQRKGVSAPEFAEKLKIEVRSVFRYLDGTRMPSRAKMQEINTLTGGMVTANDFHGLEGNKDGKAVHGRRRGTRPRKHGR